MTNATESSPSGLPRVLLIGAGGLIGRAIFALLDAEPRRYDVVGISRSTEPSLDLEDRASIERCLESLAPFDHVIVAAGEARFVELAHLDASSFALGIQSKLMGQINVTLAALPLLRRGGSITLTSGALSHTPTPGSTPAALVNAAIDTFVRALALELDDGRRLNAVSPGWVIDTLAQLGMDTHGGVSASEVGEMYLWALESDEHGQVIERNELGARAGRPRVSSTELRSRARAVGTPAAASSPAGRSNAGRRRGRRSA